MDFSHGKKDIACGQWGAQVNVRTCMKRISENLPDSSIPIITYLVLSPGKVPKQLNILHKSSRLHCQVLPLIDHMQEMII